MAALALVGAMMTGCSSDEDSMISNPQQPENKGNVVTLTTTVSLDGGEAAAQGTNRALTADGKKTFAAGDKIAVIYKNTSNQTVTALSEALPAGEYGKNATFTVTLTNPQANTAVRYIYPAAMLATTVNTGQAVNADENVNYLALATQNGTLATLGSTLDLAIFDGTLTDGAALPASASMTNQLAILACTLKNSDGSSDITSNITDMTVSDGTNTYGITRSAAAGPIYVAIKPTSSAKIDITATDGTKNYTKSLTGKTYAASNGYNVSWRMTEVPSVPEGAINGKFTINASGKQVYFSKGNLQYVGTWQFATNQWDCFGTSQSTDHRDLFGWNTAENPNQTSTNNSVYSSTFIDWGTKIDDGSTWFTLTSDEWNYLFKTRTNWSLKYGHARVNNVYGLIILPDSWKLPNGLSFNYGSSYWTPSMSNTYTTEQWAQMEAAGAVFLPAAGGRSGTTTSSVGGFGSYWSSTRIDADKAYCGVYVSSNSVNLLLKSVRYYGRCVRLVRAVE